MGNKIVFVEDDMLLGPLITTALTEKGYDVIFHNSLEGFMAGLSASNPDLLILDIEVGKQSSLDVLPFVRSAYPAMPIIMASSHTGGDEVVCCLEAGANHYIKKPYEIQELHFHINRLLQVESIKENAPQVRLGDYLLDISTHQLYYKEKLVHPLSPKEFAVLFMLLKNRGKLVQRTDLKRQVWGNDTCDESLNNVIALLRKYIKKDPRIKIQTLKTEGYIFSVHY